MKKLILIFATLLSLMDYSQARIPDDIVNLKGKTGFLSTSAVSVRMDQNNMLVTRFNANLKDVTITVFKEDGEIVFIQTINTEEFDSVVTEIKNYTPGNYYIEIEAPEGSLEGKF